MKKETTQANKEKVKANVEQNNKEDKRKEQNKTKENADKKADKKEKELKKPDKKDSSKENQSEIEKIKTELTETKDKYIRLSAEFDNYRKRTLKEKMDIIQNASGDVLSGILPIIDDFERALKVMDQSDDFNSAKEGITLIHSKLNEFMKNKNIVEIEAQNAIFDTDLHEAITKIPAPSEDLKGKVVDVVQKGYKINDKVIRFAKVVIGE